MNMNRPILEAFRKGCLLGLITAFTLLSLGCVVGSNSDSDSENTTEIQRIFDITNLGAVGGCPADDSYIIQKAINLASKAEGTAFIPAGTYCVGKTLIMKSNVTLEGVGDASTLQALGEFDLIRYHGSPNHRIVNTTCLFAPKTAPGFASKIAPP